MGDSQMSSFMMGKKKMEVNASHPIMIELKKKFLENENDRTIKDLVWLIYDTAALTSGFSLQDPVTFAGRIRKGGIHGLRPKCGHHRGLRQGLQHRSQHLRH